MLLNKKWLIGFTFILLGLFFNSCIEDDEEQFKCVPTIPAEADLVDSWTVEYNQYVHKVGEDIIEEQNFTKQQGKNLLINKDYTWTYTEKAEGKDINYNGTWAYHDGKLLLTSRAQNGEEITNEIQVFRLCSLRLRGDFKYKEEVDGIINDYAVTVVLLRTR